MIVNNGSHIFENGNVFLTHNLEIIDTAFDKVDFAAWIIEQHRYAALRKGMLHLFCFRQKYS